MPDILHHSKYVLVGLTLALVMRSVQNLLRALKQAVRRNRERFPPDFMFVLSPGEFDDWRSQIVISSADRKGLRYAPMAFTEQGVAMLSSVLRSKRAVGVNVQSEQPVPR